MLPMDSPAIVVEAVLVMPRASQKSSVATTEVTNFTAMVREVVMDFSPI